MKKSRIVVASLMAAAIMVATTSSFAAFSGSPVTNTLIARANVVARCSVGGTTLDFGDFDPLAGVAGSAAAQFSIQCVAGTVATITMAAITNMTNGSSVLTYQIGQNPGDSSWGSKVYTATNSSPQMIDVYGVLPATQPGVSALGVHLGSATITVTF